MRQIVQQALAEARRWSSMLLLGDSANSTRSMYAQLIEQEDRLQQRRSAEGAIKVRESLLSNSLINDVYRRQLDHAGTISRMLDHVRWTVQLDSGSWNLNVDSAEGGALALGSVDALLAFARRPFVDIARNEYAAKVLRETYLREAELTRSIQEKAGMLAMTGTADNMQPLPANFLQVQTRSGDDDEFFNRVKDQIGASSGAKADHVQLLKTNDPYRCIVLNTRDLVPIDALKTYQECQEAYVEVMAQSMVGEDGKNAQRLSHVLPAEVHAVGYEARLVGDLEQSYRALNPAIITYLEYPDRFKLFLQAWIAGLIKIETTERKDYFAYFLSLPIDPQGNMLEAPFRVQLTRDDENPDRLQLTDAIDTFIFRAKDVRSGFPRSIDWAHVELNERRLVPPDDASRLEQIDEARKVRVPQLSTRSPRYRDLAALFELTLIDMRKSIIARGQFQGRQAIQSP
jgi:hypothetical protein